MSRLLVLFATVLLTTTVASAHLSIIKKENNQEFRLEKVAGNVHVLFGTGGNIGVSFGKDGLMTIDTQFSNNFANINSTLAKLTKDKPKFVFNTHHHGDHTGSNELFGVDSTIIAHYNVRERLLNRMGRDGKKNPVKDVGLPMITYSKSVSVFMNGEQVKAVHYPNGHTDGDTIIYFTGSNAVHMGDTFFKGRFPFVDLNSGGKVSGLVGNIGKVLQTIPADAKIIPGHGSVATIDDLRDYHSMLVDTTTIVRKHMAAGKSLEEIKKAGLGEKYKSLSWRFITEERWIDTIYKSYSPKMMK